MIHAQSPGRGAAKLILAVSLGAAGLIAGCKHSDGSQSSKMSKSGATEEASCPMCAAKATTAPTSKPSADSGAMKPTPATMPAAQADWKQLFDGKSLTGWKSAEFGGQGEPAVENGAMSLPAGVGLTGIVYTGAVPKMSYEVAIEAKRVDGADFFCGLTFPVNDTHASLIIGGWGGSLCGISSLNGDDAAHNETRTNKKLQTGKWYTVRLQVLPDRLVAFIDDEKIIDVETKGKEINVRQDIDQSKPFGLSSWQTSAAIRSVKVRPIAGK